MTQYKQKCSKCSVNYVLVNSWRERNPVCYECQKKEMEGIIDDPVMAKMFDIPEELYLNSHFLRSIKVNYLKYGGLSDRQIESFQKAVLDITTKANGSDELTLKKSKSKKSNAF